jgi:serine/threonine protein kinase
VRFGGRKTRSARVLAHVVRVTRRCGEGPSLRYRAGVTAEELLPRQFGDFELLRLISSNETGRIYRGSHRGFRASNVRVFSRLYTCDEAAVQTLRSDLQTDHLIHEYITGGSCFAPFRFGQTVVQAMSPRPGVDLAHRLEERGAMPWPEARSVLLDVCRGLAFAHANLVVHGDLKPENCFCQEATPEMAYPRRTLVMGFGLARAYRRAFSVWRPGEVEPTEAPRLFPVYMAPEQAAGEQPTVRSDIYALGVLMLHLLTGERPRASGAPPAVERVDPGACEASGGPLTPALLELALKATAREPVRRFPSVYEFAAALVAADGGDPEAELAGMSFPVSSSWR